MSIFLSNEQVTRAKKIKLLVLDVDGVLSDGRLTFANSGMETKAFNVKDGLGIKLIMSAGIQVAIITGRSSDIVKNRATALGISSIIQGREDKGAALATLCAELGVMLSECAYMGDDWPDLSALMQVGFAAAPKDAHTEVVKRVHFVSDHTGGQAAVRQLCDVILLAQRKYKPMLERYLTNAGVDGVGS